MLSCKEVTRKIAKQEKLSFMQRLEIKMHMFICNKCRFFTQQMQALSQAARNSFQMFQTENKQEIDQLKNKIKAKL